MDDRVLHPGNVTDGLGRRSRQIKVIGEFPELRGRQIKVERLRNRSLDGNLVVDAGRRQAENPGGRSRLSALTGSGSNDTTFVVTNDCKDQLSVLWNNHRRFTASVITKLRRNCG